MANAVETTNLIRWTQLLEQQQEKQLLALLCDAPTIEVAEFLAQQLPQKSLALFTLLPQELQGAIFADFEE